METKQLRVTDKYIDFTEEKVKYIIIVDTKKYLLQNVNSYYLITKNKSYLFEVDYSNMIVLKL